MAYATKVKNKYKLLFKVAGWLGWNVRVYNGIGVRSPIYEFQRKK